MFRAAKAMTALDARVDSHMRGKFNAYAIGVTFGGGQSIPMNKKMTSEHWHILRELLADEYIIAISNFTNGECRRLLRFRCMLTPSQYP